MSVPRVSRSEASQTDISIPLYFSCFQSRHLLKPVMELCFVPSLTLPFLCCFCIREKTSYPMNYLPGGVNGAVQLTRKCVYSLYRRPLLFCEGRIGNIRPTVTLCWLTVKVRPTVHAFALQSCQNRSLTHPHPHPHTHTHICFHWKYKTNANQSESAVSSQ